MISRRRKSATHKGDIKISGNTDRQPSQFLPRSRVQTAWGTSSASDQLLGVMHFLRERASLCLELICTRDHLPICGSDRALAPPPHAVGGEQSPQDQSPRSNKEEQTLTSLGLNPAISTFARVSGKLAGRAMRRALTLVLMFYGAIIEARAMMEGARRSAQELVPHPTKTPRLEPK
jgi:hypothetical protein